jgi:hypothetical protein
MEGLDQEAKMKQTLKCNHFLMIAQRALIKHFKAWINGLVFLAIYGEGPTGRIVARYLSPPNTMAAITPGVNEMQAFESTHLQQSINSPEAVCEFRFKKV